LTSWAGEGDAGNYSLSGKVLAGSAKGAHSYQVATESRIYLLLCEGDTLVARAEKKWAYVSSGKESGGREQKYRILSETEDEAAPEAKDAATDIEADSKPDSKPESK
jgi:hypothetical protein